MSLLVERVFAAACVMFCAVANGQLFLNRYRIETSVTAVHPNGGVDAEMIIRAPSAVLFSSPYELKFEVRTGAVDFISSLASFRFRVTQEQFLAYNLQNLLQDEYYTIQVQVQDVFRNVQPSSDPFTLLTTGLQSITAEAPGFEDAMVTCHFLMGARADGCLVQWSEVNSTLGSGGSLQISRAANSFVATGMITGLQENTIYTVQAFGTRVGVNLHADLPIVLASNLHTLERPTVDGQTEMVPTLTATTISTTLNSSTTPTTETSSTPVTPFLVNIIPALIVGIVALGVSIIVACACVHTKMRKHRPAQMENGSNNKIPHSRHIHLAQIQQNGSNIDNVVPEVHPHAYDYIEAHPSSPVYAVADAESCSSSLTASGGEYLYVDKSISFHPRNFSPRVDEMMLKDNCAYNASLTQSPTQLPLDNESSN